MQTKYVCTVPAITALLSSSARDSQTGAGDIHVVRGQVGLLVVGEGLVRLPDFSVVSVQNSSLSLPLFLQD